MILNLGIAIMKFFFTLPTNQGEQDPNLTMKKKKKKNRKK